MRNLNKYQKIRIILLVEIIIATVILIISTVKASTVKNYETEETLAEATSVIEEEDVEDVDETEDEEDTSWDEEDVEDTEVDMNDEENAEENNSSKYYLKVNYTANVVTAYTKDSSGKYTVAVRAMICSTGTATPRSGVYAISNQYRWHQLNGGVYGQYCSRITGHILFHSVPYASNSPSTLKYTAYDKLGTSASSGCVRLTVEDAMWIYNNCSSGTYVEFYSSSDPGPLGKPTAQKISSNIECRNWDPTDPTAGNPWHSYVATSTTTTETTTETTNSQETSSEITENNSNTEQENTSNNEDNSESNTNSDNETTQETETNNTSEENTTNEDTNSIEEENTSSEGM